MLVLAMTTGSPAGCSPTGYRSTFSRATPPASVERSGDFLKCHTRDGRVYVLTRWTVGPTEVTGEGVLYDAERNLVGEGRQAVLLADVALFETTKPETIPRSPAGYVVLGVVTAASLAITAYCATNPKACFGSCPTFYVHDGKDWRLEAEGFSASVAKPLEETDIDAMWTAHGSGHLEVQMTNEALETHLVDAVHVLAAPRPPGMRVYRAEHRYFAARGPTPPDTCDAEGSSRGAKPLEPERLRGAKPLEPERVSCLEAVRAIDERAWLSSADAEDLATKEVVTLRWDRPDRGRLGLVFAARNSLLNTFVFYQGLAYAGRGAVGLFARLERGGAGDDAELADKLRAFGRVLGGIEVEVEEAPGRWRAVGRYDEVGPIAREVQLVPLPELPGARPLHVRLTMTKGYWKLDHVGLATLAEEVRPVVVGPARVTKDGRDAPDALARLQPGGERLVTYPGDLYALHFELPPGDHELFLSSRGYYYEWMRQQWLADENPLAVAEMIEDPHAAMRRLAPRYKRIEDRMEAIFWQSRVGVRR